MGNKAYEATGKLSILHTWNKSFYTFFISIVLFVSSLSLPFRYHSFGLKFTKFLDANDRHCIFLLCNGILFFLFLNSGSKHTSEAYSQDNQAVEPEAKQIECNEISLVSVLEEETEVTHDQIEDMETKQVIHVCNEHEIVTNVKQIVVDDHEYQIEDQETELALHDDNEHEIVAEVVVEEEEHDDQEGIHEFQQKCESFIKKVRQSMHHEGRSHPMIDCHKSADE